MIQPMSGFMAFGVSEVHDEADELTASAQAQPAGPCPSNGEYTNFPRDPTHFKSAKV
jgi:hypothetical protein